MAIGEWPARCSPGPSSSAASAGCRRRIEAVWASRPAAARLAQPSIASDIKPRHSSAGVGSLFAASCCQPVALPGGARSPVRLSNRDRSRNPRPNWNSAGAPFRTPLPRRRGSRRRIRRASRLHAGTVMNYRPLASTSTAKPSGRRRRRLDFPSDSIKNRCRACAVGTSVLAPQRSVVRTAASRRARAGQCRPGRAAVARHRSAWQLAFNSGRIFDPRTITTTLSALRRPFAAVGDNERLVADAARPRSPARATRTGFQVHRGDAVAKPRRAARLRRWSIGGCSRKLLGVGWAPRWGRRARLSLRAPSFRSDAAAFPISLPSAARLRIGVMPSIAARRCRTRWSPRRRSPDGGAARSDLLGGDFVSWRDQRTCNNRGVAGALSAPHGMIAMLGVRRRREMPAALAAKGTVLPDAHAAHRPRSDGLRGHSLTGYRHHVARHQSHAILLAHAEAPLRAQQLTAQT